MTCLFTSMDKENVVANSDANHVELLVTQKLMQRMSRLKKILKIMMQRRIMLRYRFCSRKNRII